MLKSAVTVTVPSAAANGSKLKPELGSRRRAAAAAAIALGAVWLGHVGPAHAETYYRECSYRFEVRLDGVRVGYSSYQLTAGGYASGTGKARNKAREAAARCATPTGDCEPANDGLIVSSSGDPYYKQGHNFQIVREAYCGVLEEPARGIISVHPIVNTSNSDIRTDCRLQELYSVNAYFMSSDDC